MIRYTLLIAVSVSILLGGCSEKPERKAAKEVRKSADKAQAMISQARDQARRITLQGDAAAAQEIQKGNLAEAAAISQRESQKARKIVSDSFEKARSEIDKTLRATRSYSRTQSPALITSGNILFDHALYLQSSLASKSAPLDSYIDQISRKVMLIADLERVKTQRVKLVEHNEKEIRQFRDILDKGADNYPGLKAQLRVEEQKLVEIESQIKALRATAKKAADKANGIEKSAMQKLRDAEALSGKEKLTLKNEAYDLLLSKKKYSMQMQEANDKIAILDTRAATVAPVVNKIVNDISAINDKIDGLVNAEGNRKLKDDVKAIQLKIDSYGDSITKSVGGMTEALNAYLAEFTEINTLLDKAMEQYGKVRSGNSARTAKNRKAGCYLWKAVVYAECLRTHKGLAARIKSIITASDSATAARLGTVVETSSAKAGDFAAKALENYQLAAKEYEAVSGGCAAVKNHIIALYGKMTIAEYLGQTAESKAKQDEYYAISDDASSDAEELVKKAKECDPSFDISITARLLDGVIDFQPKLQVDLTSYYEGLRKNYQAWNTLKGAEKEAEVNKLIRELEAMKPAEDPAAFERILEPELQQLKAALKKGFDEEASGSGGSNNFGNDPNRLF